jgi:hypothetical protein
VSTVEHVETLEARRAALEPRFTELKRKVWEAERGLHQLDEAIARARHDAGMEPLPPCAPCTGTGVRPTIGGTCVYCDGTGARDRGWRDR